MTVNVRHLFGGKTLTYIKGYGSALLNLLSLSLGLLVNIAVFVIVVRLPLGLELKVIGIFRICLYIVVCLTYKLGALDFGIGL